MGQARKTTKLAVNSTRAGNTDTAVLEPRHSAYASQKPANDAGAAAAQPRRSATTNPASVIDKASARPPAPAVQSCTSASPVKSCAATSTGGNGAAANCA